MLIAVYTCKAPRYLERIQAQLETWIPALRAQGYQVEIFDGPRLGVPDGYSELTLKTWALIRWAHEHGHDRMLKIDDDGLINPYTFKPIESDYAGRRCPANDYGNAAAGCQSFAPGTFPHDWCSGGAYWLSRRAMEVLLAAHPPINDFAEDRAVGNTLAKAGIPLTELPNYYLCQADKPDWAVIMQLYPQAIREDFKRLKEYGR